ncbi:MAG: cation:proton antiporter [Atribacterota bacterium]
MNSILSVGLLLVIGFFGGLIARKFKLPTISGYIIIGMCLSLFHVIPKELINGDLNIIVEISLGIIGYLVGGTLNFGIIKRYGKQIILITFTQLMGAWILVTVLLAFLTPLIIKLDIPHPSFYQTYLPLAIIIGAISCATAPAATIAVIREYKASGPLTNTLLAVVVLDDALCIMAYALGLNIAKILTGDFGSIPWYKIVIHPILDITGSIILGTVLGFGMVYLIRFADTQKRLLVIIFGMILLCVGTAKTFNISNILANMVMGFVVTNRTKPNENAFEVIDDIDDVVFAMFFTLAGANFDLGVMKSAGILSLLIVVGRCSGKYVGARIGATISNAPSVIKKYLGFGLLPKAGVTVGLALLAKQHLTFSGTKIGNIVLSAILASVIINELIAPPLTKYALIKSGEASSEER